MIGDPGQVHPPACKLDEEQDLHSPQQDRVDGEEVARDDPGGLLAQERPPAGCDTSGRRVKVVGAQNPADRAGRHATAKANEFAVDALVAPSGFWRASRAMSCWRSSESGGRPVRTAGVGPALADYAPVPAQQRLGLRQEHRPACRGSSRLQRRQQRPIRWAAGGAVAVGGAAPLLAPHGLPRSC
jgi:hypothetical protein